MMRTPRRRPTLIERQSAFLQTYNLLNGEISEHGMLMRAPEVTAALITASAMLVIGADATFVPASGPVDEIVVAVDANEFVVAPGAPEDGMPFDEFERLHREHDGPPIRRVNHVD